MKLEEAVKILKEVSSVRINAKSARTAILTIDEVHKALQILISFVEKSPAIDEGKLVEIIDDTLILNDEEILNIKRELRRRKKEWLKEGE
jgi:phosphopantothenate synthetase